MIIASFEIRMSDIDGGRWREMESLKAKYRREAIVKLIPVDAEYPEHDFLDPDGKDIHLDKMKIEIVPYADAEPWLHERVIADLRRIERGTFNDEEDGADWLGD